jgi:hypothetical protein
MTIKSRVADVSVTTGIAGDSLNIVGEGRVVYGYLPVISIATGKGEGCPVDI